MIKTIQKFAIICCIGFVLAAAAEPVRELTWDDLIPAHLARDDYLENLTDEQRDLVLWVINTIEIPMTSNAINMDILAPIRSTRELLEITASK